MSSTRKIDLRAGERTFATILIEPEGRKVLDHELSERQLVVPVKLQPYEGEGKLTCEAAVREGPCVLLRDEAGRVRLELAEDDDGELFEVVDPKGEARLKVSLEGPGSAVDKQVQRGWLALELCRLVSKPGVMLGKRVIRGTRITAELVLRRLAAGATEDDLIRDYPQITSEDVREVLLTAAKAERGRILQPVTDEKAPKH